MSPRPTLLALAILALSGAAHGQPSPQPGPPQQVLQKNLFGEREPGDDEEEAEPPQNSAAPEAAPPPATAPSSAAYDARIRQSYAAAESFQGRLDGGWIASARGRDLLQLQLVDKGKGQVEGAWRDLLAGVSPQASGLMDPTPVKDGGFEAGFQRADGLSFRLIVRPGPDGRLTGRLWRGDELFDLTFRRTP